MAGSSMTVQIQGLSEVKAALSPAAIEEEVGPELELAIIGAAKVFLADVREHAPRRGNRRPSQWERKNQQPVGEFAKTIRMTTHRAGSNTTALVKVGSGFGNMVRSGTKAHDIFPGRKGPGHDIRLLNRQVRVVHHPGARGNRFWDEAEARVPGELEPFSRQAGTASADRIAARMKAKGL